MPPAPWCTGCLDEARDGLRSAVSTGPRFTRRYSSSGIPVAAATCASPANPHLTLMPPGRPWAKVKCCDREAGVAHRDLRPKWGGEGHGVATALRARPRAQVLGVLYDAAEAAGRDRRPELPVRHRT